MTDSYDPRLKLDNASEAPAPAAEARAAGYGQGAPLPDLPPAPKHLKEYIKVLYKRRWLVGSVFLAVMAATVAYTYTRVPIFEARTKLLIEPDDPNYINFRDVLEQDTGRTDYYQTQYDLLRSRTLARRTARQLKLDATAMPAPVSPGVIGTAVKAARGWFSPSDPVVAAAPQPDESASETRAANLVLAGLAVEPVRMSRIVDLKYRSSDPEFAAKVVNAHAKNYIEQMMEFKFMSSKEATDWLGERLAEQRKQVEAAELAVQRYRETHDAIAADDRENIVIQKLSEMNREVTRAKTTRLSKQAVYEQLRGMENNPRALETFPAILLNPVIQQIQAELAQLQKKRAEMSSTMLDTHPDMQVHLKAMDVANLRLRAEISKVVEGVRNDYQAALAQEQALSQALDQQKRDALSMTSKAIEFGVLSREAESARQLYQSLLQRAEETGVSTQLRTSNVRIVDVAERPRGPVFPRHRFNLMVGFLGGLLSAVALGFLFEYFDNRIKTPDEIRLHLRIPPLGLLPLVREATTEGTPLLSQPVSARFNESMRTLRTNVLFSLADAPSRSLMVTSTGPGEGKTMLASNLAVSLAEAGQRVLLIDGDLRRPKVQKVFGISQEPGLSNLLVGDAKASESVQKAKTANLWLLPAGRIPPNPAELLSSTRFREFLSSLREHFHWVIIDTPPVMAVTDASVVAHMVSGVVFVVGTEMVSRHAAATALDQLEHSHAKIVGGVLNRVDLDRNPYYYSQYYRKEYADYYVSTAAQ